MKIKSFFKITRFTVLLSSIGLLAGCVDYGTYPNSGYGGYQYSGAVYDQSYNSCYDYDCGSPIWSGGGYYSRYRGNQWYNGYHGGYHGGYNGGHGGYHGGSGGYHGGGGFHGGGSHSGGGHAGGGGGHSH